MKPLSWNAEYRRWRGESIGVWGRRLAIARYGLRLSLSGKIMRAFLLLAFAQSILLTGIFFFFGQLVAPDSALIGWLESVGGTQMTRVLNGLSSWALLYPDICVDGIYRLAYFGLSFSLPIFSVIIVALFVHRLVAHDLASQAIVIYSSKALTRWDYIIGKFFVVATVLSVVWILPVLVSWLLGNLLAPDWSFFYHSFPSLMRGMILGIAAVITLSCVTLMVSSLAKKTGAAVAYWVLGLLALDVASGAVGLVYPSLSYFDPFEALQELSMGLYRIPAFLSEAKAMLPFFGGLFSDVSETVEAGELPIGNGSVVVPLLWLALISVVSLFVVDRRIRQS